MIGKIIINKLSFEKMFVFDLIEKCVRQKLCALEKPIE